MREFEFGKKPRSIFDLDYYDSIDETQEWLDLAPFGNPPVIHLPSFDVVADVRSDLVEKGRDLAPLDVLIAYQKLHKSSLCSDIICGDTNASGKKCGGIMDEEVSAFGVYYQCRQDDSHKFPKP